MTSIPLTPVHRHAPPPPPPYEAPYRAFITASLVLGIGGGFAIGIAVALAGALEWGWGTDTIALSQAHGQLQLTGFSGLFIAGMAMRLMPRFSGRPLAFRALVWPHLWLMAASVALRAVAQPLDPSATRETMLAVSALLFVAGAGAFCAIIWGTLAHRSSRASATGYFFCFGAASLLASSLLNFAIVVEMVRDDLPFAPVDKSMILVFLEQYGFTLMFISGVTLRALPTLGGRTPPHRQARYAAVGLEAGVAVFAACSLRMVYGAHSELTARTADIGLLAVAVGLASVALLSAALTPDVNRVAAASRTQFWFPRTAMAWLLGAAIALAWYALRAFADERAPDAFAMDAARHMLAIGVMSMMIVGMAMLIVPEFAGRRLQHPRERAVVLAMVIALNLAAALRVWPSVEGIDWIEATRNWPMAIGGSIAEGVIIVFGLMFAQSWFEQRKPGWGAPERLDRGE